MVRKPVTTRTALITAAAMATGSAAGTAAEALASQLSYTGPGLGSTATAIVAAWMLDKLDTLIDDPK